MSGIFDAIGSFQWETLFQLVSVALIMIAGPAVIFVLAFRNGDL
ncbi:photosystem II reaction center protein Ycf12 [Chroococcidiopsis sp [FACHB-1243]]|nr:photosystem II reaction center protein Ycf12 [Chroococcidiopsis sp. [FACHB-1243]]